MYVGLIHTSYTASKFYLLISIVCVYITRLLPCNQQSYEARPVAYKWFLLSNIGFLSWFVASILKMTFFAFTFMLIHIKTG